ncbi:flagellar filament capping protein FliD [Azohydromonas lata]|uniref:Flagellar hook-associated protein 2 n=1 Tax=Azohydromonas lata TaxID=45677 RepID=A0ABU5IDR7_9BURK|nr:flagellar filament capping protein FliD [Azohydromonas lata]MDZ5457241.1 flagellar filament capping protein FliD [Azohydromonas lata]
MATLSSTGIGSGLNVSSILSQLEAVERKPIDNLQTAAKSIDSQISAYGKIQSLMSTLRDSAAALASTSLWKQGTATPSDTTVMSATATSGGLAAGDYAVSVSQIARAQTLYSRALSSSAAVVGAGSLTIQLMSGYSPPTPKDGSTAVQLDFSDPNTTLEQVRDRINGADLGVNASLIRDATGAARLALTAKNSGTQNQISITGTDGLAGFSYPPSDTSDVTNPDRVREGQSAQDAKLTINGVPVTASSNQIADALPGVTLNLTKETTTPITLSVKNDNAAQEKAVQDFVTAYNALNTQLVNQTKYDDATKTAGTLQGDSAALSIRSQMRSLLHETNGASSVFSSLQAIGLSTQTDGTIKVDSTKLKKALEQPAEVAKLFSSTDSDVKGNNGLGVRFRELLGGITGSGGLLTSRTEGLQSKLKRNQDEQARLEDRVNANMLRLQKQYQALDSKMSSLNSLSTYITQQVTAMNNSG